jgi:hypothetical protein
MIYATLPREDVQIFILCSLFPGRSAHRHLSCRAGVSSDKQRRSRNWRIDAKIEVELEVKPLLPEWEKKCYDRYASGNNVAAGCISPPGGDEPPMRCGVM